MRSDRPVAVLLTSHWVSLAGTCLVTTAGLLWLFALPAQARGRVDNPYTGIVLFLILPLMFCLGLALIPLGVLLAKRRVASGWVGSPPERAAAMRKLLLFLGVTTIANVAIGSQLSYRAVQHMETTQFCGQSCHVMKPEFTAHAVAPHAQVPCVSCHVSSGATGWIQSKINGTRQLYEVVSHSVPRPIPPGLSSGRLVASEESCETCHARGAGPGVRLKIIPKHAEDEANTPNWTVLAMHMAGGRLGGIHGAHMGPGVAIRYAATDAARQTIPWVEVTRGPNNTVTAYLGKDVKPDSLAALPRFAMQCVDCHNRAAHSFERPDAALDRAIASGEIPVSLPFVRKKGGALLAAEYASEEDARARMSSELGSFYEEAYPALARSNKKDIDCAGLALAAIWSRNVFPDLKVDWGTYPNNLGHEDSPGCFRCHDGDHATADGSASIGQDCASCHEALAVEEPNPAILTTLGLTAQ